MPKPADLSQPTPVNPIDDSIKLQQKAKRDPGGMMPKDKVAEFVALTP